MAFCYKDFCRSRSNLSRDDWKMPASFALKLASYQWATLLELPSSVWSVRVNNSGKYAFACAPDSDTDCVPRDQASGIFPGPFQVLLDRDINGPEGSTSLLKRLAWLHRSGKEGVPPDPVHPRTRPLAVPGVQLQRWTSLRYRDLDAPERKGSFKPPDRGTRPTKITTSSSSRPMTTPFTLFAFG